MSALTDLATEIQTQLELLVASGTIVDISNQRDADSTKNDTIIGAACNHAGRMVQRYLGRSVDDSDNDAVDFGVRLALLRMVAVDSATLTEAGAAYMSGVMRELAQEAEARRQAVDSFEISESDHVSTDLRYPESTWDRSVDPDNY